MGVIEKAVAWAIEIAQDNSHGYSQANRWGPDYDCSSFVISAYEQAGLKLREAGASYTGNMRAALLSCGFVDVTTQIGLASGYGIQPGDVLLNYSAHTCIAVGGGKVANCRTDEGHPQAGDQSGQEIRVQAYWNFPWNAVLRFKGKEQDQPTVVTAPPQNVSTGNGQNLTLEDHSMNLPLLTTSNKFNDYCVLLQSLLNVRHWACGSCDGFFGPKTEGAVNKAREFFGMERNGKCDKSLWAKLLETR